MNLKIVKGLLKFVRKARELKDITPYEYVQKLTGTKRYVPEENEIETYLSYIKHEKLLSTIADTFVKRTTLSKVSKLNLTILFYIFIFDLDEENVDEVLNTLRIMRNPNTLKLLYYLKDENNLITVAQDGCKVFDNEYVINKIINPLLDKSHLLDYLSQILEEDKQYSKKPPTVPLRLRVSERAQKIPQAPANTPLPSLVNITTRDVPNTTYTGDRCTKQQLQQRYEKNKLRAIKLMEVAKKLAPRTALVKRREDIPGIISPSSSFKASKAPPVKDVALKHNFTTIIREAAIHIKDQENEVKKIESLIKGGFDSEKFKRIEQDFRRAKEEELVAEIEKKRLKCLITREEAILAKKNLLKMNRAKTLEYHKQRIKMVQEVENWKKEEELRIREQVEKVHEVEESARESFRKLQESKQAIAKYAKYESKKIQEQIYQEKQQELTRKVELIKEIKTWHQVRAVHVKEYDPTECPNLGLLCEMSIAELQERLVLLAMKTNQELEDKKRKIAYRKKKHLEFVEDAKTFVEQARLLKIKTKKNEYEDELLNSTSLDRHPEVVELRSRLEYVKNLRHNA